MKASKVKKQFLFSSLTLFLFYLFFTSGCGNETDSFSTLSAFDAFSQNATYTQQKIDVLWVIDNSNSMRSSQESVAENFNRFISQFLARNYDFQMAVTTTEAYRELFEDGDFSSFRDGTDNTSHTGIPIVSQTTLNVEETFITNILQGDGGHGDERAFLSFKMALNNVINSGFIRHDAFLAVIIVSDEDDFSHLNANSIQDPNNTSLDPVSSYVDFLKELKKEAPFKNYYSVSAIAVFDEDCLSQVNDFWTGRKIAYRYTELIELTNGSKASLCSNFGDNLEMISDSIVELSSMFALDREPFVETIKVYVNGNEILPDSINGWTYNEENNSILFHGESIPPDGANISIRFEPKTVKL